MAYRACTTTCLAAMKLSQRAPVFQSRMPQPYIKLNPADAAKLGVNAGTRVSFSYDGNMVTLPVEISEGLTAGQVGLPMGMSGIAAGTGWRALLTISRRHNNELDITGTD